jgi:hypothetical protein
MNRNRTENARQGCTLGLGMISILSASASTSLLIAFKFTHLIPEAVSNKLHYLLIKRRNSLSFLQVVGIEYLELLD